jgi:hypothetical protein
VERLYSCGAAAGGGAAKSARDVVAVLSTLLPREAVVTTVHMEES